MSGWRCRGTPKRPTDYKYNQRNRGSQRAWQTPRRADAAARTPIIGVEEWLYARDRRKTTKKLKPNSLQSLNRLPPHKRLMGWQGEGLASGLDSGWPRVRGLLGLPRLPRTPPLWSRPWCLWGCPATPGWGGPSHPHRVTGMGLTGPKARETSTFSCVAGWPRKA